jgi:ABC-type nitrate/sulfonate/bicarbonate transport system permease component
MTARRTSEILIGLLPIALILALWHGIAASGVAPPSLLPAPRAVFTRFAEQLGNPVFLQHAATTVFRLFVGFGIAVVVGVTAGVAATGSRAVEALLRPVVRVLAPVPKIALYPAFILILGFEHASKIALVAADAVFPILLATYHGTSAVEPKLVWSALAAGTPQRKALFTIVLPAALPSVLTGCRIGLVISCIVVFLAEMITSTNGLGHLLIYAARSFETVDMFVPLITISLLGLALNAGFNALQARLLIGFPEEG